MSTNAAFKLQDAGFSRAQVEALGEFLDTQAATKTDLAETEHRLDARIADLHSEMKLLEQRMTIKLGGLMVLAVGVLLAAIRYLPPAGPMPHM
ncbi:hypothetical protein [Phaeospirillum tilakii]|uniref:DUF1640 domain-containing protein n=1 Tax=Phaeospirillum tilakii TaxID=741673 RepID=A0ABW5CGV3_9PROT